MGIATSLRSCLTKATQAAARYSSRATKRKSVKRPRKRRHTCRHTTRDNRESNGPLKHQLPGRERAVLSHAKSFVLEAEKRRKYEIAKSRIRFDRSDVFVRGQVVGTAGEDRLRSQHKLRAIQDLFVGTS